MKKKILIVDDQREVRELVEVTMRGEEYRIFQASSGEEALELAREERPDLVILDVTMPGGMDGYETCERLKEEDGGAGSCRVLFLTAKGQEAERDRGLEAGAVGYFVKPFSPLELLAKVDELLA